MLTTGEYYRSRNGKTWKIDVINHEGAARGLNMDGLFGEHHAAFSSDCLHAFAGKVNPSGLPLDKEEFDIALSADAAKKMREWYEDARSNPDWRLIEQAGYAIDMLAEMQTFRIPVPN